MLIKAKSIEIKDIDGNILKFNIGRLPAITGREIVAGYPTSMIPKVGDYEVNETLMIKLMGFVEGYNGNGDATILNGVHMINSYIPDATTLMLLEFEILKYNFPFLNFGKNKGFIDNITEKVKVIAFDVISKAMKSK